MIKKLDFITLEIGSTITKANGFVLVEDAYLSHMAQGFAPTTVEQGNVGIGLYNAIENMEIKSGYSCDSAKVFANSSAAGGLRVTVHGLTLNMTARAAREASLGAGAIIKMVTAGELTSYDEEEIEAIEPNMVVLAGGVDSGAREEVIKNAIRLAAMDLKAPVVYAGNSSLSRAIGNVFRKAGQELIITENVFPEVDVLNVEPLRKAIQNVFSKNIIKAPGMERLSSQTDYPVIPTPGAVMNAATLFAELENDVLVVDVGGATTDVHSVTDGSVEFSNMLTEPEPRTKRTVEGDLGVFVNATNIIEKFDNAENRVFSVKAIPTTDDEKATTKWLCSNAVQTAVKRHCGQLMDLFTPSGKRQIVKGKDLSAIKSVIGTGGALTRVNGGAEVLRSICTGPGKYLLPEPSASIILDKNYLFSAMGTIAVSYPDLVKSTLQKYIDDIKAGKDV